MRRFLVSTALPTATAVSIMWSGRRAAGGRVGSEDSAAPHSDSSVGGGRGRGASASTDGGVRGGLLRGESVESAESPEAEWPAASSSSLDAAAASAPSQQAAGVPSTRPEEDSVLRTVFLDRGQTDARSTVFLDEQSDSSFLDEERRERRSRHRQKRSRQRQNHYSNSANTSSDHLWAQSELVFAEFESSSAAGAGAQEGSSEVVVHRGPTRLADEVAGGPGSPDGSSSGGGEGTTKGMRADMLQRLERPWREIATANRNPAAAQLERLCSKNCKNLFLVSSFELWQFLFEADLSGRIAGPAESFPTQKKKFLKKVALDPKRRVDPDRVKGWRPSSEKVLDKDGPICAALRVGELRTQAKPSGGKYLNLLVRPEADANFLLWASGAAGQFRGAENLFSVLYRVGATHHGEHAICGEHAVVGGGTVNTPLLAVEHERVSIRVPS